MTEQWWSQDPVVESSTAVPPPGGKPADAAWWGQDPVILRKADSSNDAAPAQRRAINYNDLAQAQTPTGDASAAVGRGLVNGVPIVGPYLLNGLNHAAAGVRSLQHGTPFADELRAVEQFGERTAAAHPGTTTAAEFGGGVVGTAPLIATAPAAFGLGAASLPARMLASGGSGGLLGATDAAVRSDGDGDAVLQGMATGGAFGVAGPAIGAAVGAGARGISAMRVQAASPVPGMNRAAARRIVADVRETGGPEVIRTRMGELGPEAMLLDTSPTFEGRAQGLAVLPDTRETVTRPLVARAEGANARLGADVNRHLGPNTDPAAFHAALDTAYDEAVPPLYRRAVGQPHQVDTSGVLETIGRLGSAEKGGAETALRQAWRLLHTEGDVPSVGRSLVPDRRPEALHNAKEALDGMIAQAQAQKGSAARSEVAALTSVRRGLNDALETQLPGYAEANRTAQGFFKRREAFDRGQTLLNGGREAVRPGSLAQDTATMAPEISQAQRAGLRTEIDRLVGTQLDDRSTLRRALLGEGDFNRARLNTVFGEGPVAGLAGAVDREGAFDAVHRRIVDASANAARRRAADDVGVRDLAPGSGNLGTVVAGAAGGAQGVAAAYSLKAGKLLANVLGLRADLARNRQLAGAVTLRQGDALDQLLNGVAARLAAQDRAGQVGRGAERGAAVLVHSQADRARPEPRPFGFGSL